MSIASPLGLSEVTVQGPSFMRRSASARRRRTESWVQASLRIMALWIGSASSSDNSVMGKPAAPAHDAIAKSKTPAFTTAIVAWGQGRKWPILLFVAPFINRVKFAADQSDGGDQVHPNHQGDLGAD